MLETLSKLLNQAENAATDAEAEAFFAKAQELATLHAISLAEARAHTEQKQRREQPTHEQIVIGAPRQHINSHICLLSSTVGHANSLRTNIASNNTFIIWFGLPSDIEKARLLLSSISHQMARGADRFVRSRVWETEVDRETGQPMTSRRARKSYYSMYVRVIGARLNEARRSAQEQYDSGKAPGGAELVLRGKELEVRDYYDQTSTARGAWRGNRSSFTSASALDAAQSDARRARLDAQPQIGGARRGLAS